MQSIACIVNAAVFVFAAGSKDITSVNIDSMESWQEKINISQSGKPQVLSAYLRRCTRQYILMNAAAGDKMIRSDFFELRIFCAANGFVAFVAAFKKTAFIGQIDRTRNFTAD